MLKIIFNSLIAIIALSTIYYGFLNRKRLKNLGFLSIPLYLLILSGLSFFNLEIPENIRLLVYIIFLFLSLIFLMLGPVAVLFSETDEEDIKKEKLAKNFGHLFLLSDLIVLIITIINLIKIFSKFWK